MVDKRMEYLMLFNPTFGKVRQPPAERVRFILILKMLGPLIACSGAWLRALALRLAVVGVGRSSHGSARAGEIQIGQRKGRVSVPSIGLAPRPVGRPAPHLFAR